MIMDDDTKEHLLSYEESEMRLISILQFLGTMLLLVSISLLRLCPFEIYNWSKIIPQKVLFGILIQNMF